MKNFGLARLSDFFGDRVVYRNLVPCDPALPGLQTIAPQIGLAAGRIPRKSEVEYARVVVHFLEAAKDQDAPGSKIERLIFVGDTRLLDGSAYSHLLTAGGWPGLAFIGSETSAAPQISPAQMESGAALLLSNRWRLLKEFDLRCAELGLPIDAGTAVVIDLDKTALGARGRNAGVIDAARIQAVEETVADLLGAAFDARAFRDAYDPLNQPEFHPFTGDNQDYLAYICLILGSGLYTLDALMAAVRRGRFQSFEQFIASVEERRTELPPQLAAMHADIYSGVQVGDPTPFKAFRRREYLTTIQRLGCFPDNTPIERLLSDEILITHEVRAMALEWRQRGALLFGLSDKPDEAALPSAEQIEHGWRSLHQTLTHSVGEALGV